MTTRLKHPFLMIGNFAFEKVIAKSDVQARDPEQNYSKVKPVPVKIVAWLLDHWQFGNTRMWHPKKTKWEKLKELTAMVEEKKIHRVIDKDLNAAGINFVEILRIEREYRKGLIIVSLDLEQRDSLEDKKLERTGPKLIDTTTAKATTAATRAKISQAQAKLEESNSILDRIENLCKAAWEKL